MREKGYHFWWTFLPLIGLVIWGCFGITENLWYDEAYSAALVTHTPWEIVRITASDVHSPFYYFLLKIFWSVLGPAAGFRCLKWFSILFLAGYMLLGKYYVKKFFGERISVWFQFFSIVMPIMLVQSGTVRMYTLALFFMTLSELLMLDLFQSASRGKWVLFFLASLCSVYSHTYAMLQMVFLYLIFLGAILYQKKYELLKGFFICGAAVALLFLPWLFVIFLQLKQRAGGTSAGADAVGMVVSVVGDCLREWFTALEKPIRSVQYAEMGLAVFLCWNGARWMKSRKNRIPGLGMLALGLTFAASLAVYLITGQGFFGRVFFPGFASVMLLYAAGMEQIRTGVVKGLAVAAALVCFFVQFRSELELEYDPGLDTWRNFVEEQVREGDVVAAPNVHTLYLSVFCPRTDFQIYSYLPGNSPFRAGVFGDWSQLGQAEGETWYVCAAAEYPDFLQDRFVCEEVLAFHYMYQDFLIFRIRPLPAQAAGS